DGTEIRFDTEYCHGTTIFYRKEVPGEPTPPAPPAILYRDEHLLVVDKLHGIPVTPSGNYIERSLLFQLQRLTGLTDLCPLHRLDRETAGVLLFSTNAKTRAVYHRLFEQAQVEREYRAASYVVRPIPQRHWRIENRIDSGEPWYRQQIVDGATNAITDIEMIAVGDRVAEFRLQPGTGKK